MSEGRPRRRPRRRRSGGADRDRSSALDAAARRLGIERLYPEQVQVIRHVLSGGDCLAVLPTGYGKSALYQVPSMLLPRPVVVVSPLLALRDASECRRELAVRRRGRRRTRQRRRIW
jgi:ATP-dependent DNA helicase RecQ